LFLNALVRSSTLITLLWVILSQTGCFLGDDTVSDGGFFGSQVVQSSHNNKSGGLNGCFQCLCSDELTYFLQQKQTDTALLCRELGSIQLCSYTSSDARYLSRVNRLRQFSGFQKLNCQLVLAHGLPKIFLSVIECARYP
jgi:hypothetical protein